MVKHILHIGIGNLTGTEAKAHVKKIKEKAKDFFPVPTSVLYISHLGTNNYVETVHFD